MLYDYFVAPTDAEAAATIDRVGGPGQPDRPAPMPKKGYPNLGSPVYSTMADTGVDPVVQGGTLEELLTGRPYEQIDQDPRSGDPLAVRDGGERLVLTLTDGLIGALARSTPDQLAAAAIPWSQTEEFWGAGDPEQLTPLLVDYPPSPAMPGRVASPCTAGFPSENRILMPLRSARTCRCEWRGRSTVTQFRATERRGCF